jgi:BirA family biotin operon repressor/biotin-[acetyl-CoA-carboxylase] ligase
MRLDPRASVAGVRLIAHDTLLSTNTEALALGRGGERGPLWVVARQQTAGRGRQGRTWISKPGNLYATLLLTAPAPPEHWAELSFVAALATYDAIVGLAPPLRARLRIKWPNDLLLDGRKVAGVLIEGEGAGPDGEGGLVAIGVGVNCVNHPDGVDYPATDLSAGGAVVAVEELFRALSATMLGRLAQWNQGRSFATIRADWLARAHGIGEDIRIRVGDRETVGRFEGIDDAGRLLLRRPDGTLATIAAGDVLMPISGSRTG